MAASLLLDMGFFSSDPLTHFPVVRGRRLDGTDVRFPDDLPADATLMIVSFRDELDPLSDQWARLGERMAEGRGGRFAVIETPVVNAKLRLLGGLATVGIRGQVQNDAEQARTVPIYADIKRFRKALKVRTSDVYAVLVARDGRIMWRGEGDIDMDEVAELEAAVDEMLRQPVPPFTDHPDVETPNAEPLADDADESTSVTADEDGEKAEADGEAGEPLADGAGDTEVQADDNGEATEPPTGAASGAVEPAAGGEPGADAPSRAFPADPPARGQ